MKTLPDFLDKHLCILSVGLNPSPASVRAGYYFAGRGNRFWPALNRSGMAGRVLDPGPAACRHLLEVCRIGHTDVVKRPSCGAGDLRAADYRRWIPRLIELIDIHQPAVLWFHGKIAYRHYLRWRGETVNDLGWGWQPQPQQSAQVYLSPNPSAANAVFRLEDLVAAYRELMQGAAL
jgi:double-stranded uracil-DNA glycosylase